MSVKDDGKQNTENAKVLKLGFNISVSGDPDSDFQIVLDDSEQKAFPSALQKETEISTLGILPKTLPVPSKRELEINAQEPKLIENASAVNDDGETSRKIEQKSESSLDKQSSLIDEIKCTLEHFETFSNHLRDVPRLRGHPTATSTPFSDKNNSKSESNLIHPQFRHRKFSHLYDYNYRKNDYFYKPLKPDLFLKPLPGENLYRSGFYTRYKTDSLRPYVSDSSLNKTSDFKTVCSKAKYDDLNLDTPGILKKPDSESGDKHSTSSADSIKDIKIYQSGGILIMQNFKENFDAFEKKEISNLSAKLIENCSRLKEETSSFQGSYVKGMGFSSDEGRNHGKVVQFDLSGFENQKLKSGDSSFSGSKDEKFPSKQGSSDSISDSAKIKDSSPQCTSQSQDFLSLSTVENESTISNQFGLSPTYSSTKKLEWDSGADVGYYNSDLSKENLSAIEKYVLSHLSSDSQGTIQNDFSKFAQVRIASHKLIEEIREEREKKQQESKIIEKKDSPGVNVEVVELSDDEPVKSAEVATSRGITHSKSEKPNPATEVPTQKPKGVQLADKSMNVNTLFENMNLNPSRQSVTSEGIRNVGVSNRKSPKSKKFRKSKPSQKITWGPQKRRFSLENLNKNCELPAFELGISKSTYKNSSGNLETRDVELSREVEEIVIDQRFKIKQKNISSAKDIAKPSTAPNVKENKPKRPISGSSSSNNTVLPVNIENKEKDKKEVPNTNKYSDQIIQTSGLDCESVAVQAFESRRSSDCHSRTGDEIQKAEKKANNVNLSSKNIQVFGLNASLPKELAHPKETNFPENQYTKSTQYFGGPINSLPNYHSSPITKPGESCGRFPNVLNTKKKAEAEIMRLNEENKKNILTNDSEKISSKKSSDKNKENLRSKNSKKSHSSASQKSKDVSGSEKKDIEVSSIKSDKNSALVEGQDYLNTSDEVSSKVLTSEVLKEHGGSIDRNIIQEKYFQSQLIELKKKKMVSRSTSVDFEIDGSIPEKESVGCQYSSLSRDITSEEESKDQMSEGDLIGKSKQKSQRTETTDQYDSSPNNLEEEMVCTSKDTNQGQITGDSLPSSTQTAHSWFSGVQIPEQDKNGVGRARSFEYLPGHVYENSGNLRRELPSETEQNSVTSSSTGNQSITEGGRDSEGRNTLILKNSTDNSHESNQLKILDENLTELNLVVSKLWEKEAAIKNLSQSLFLNLWRKNGSGDNIDPADTVQTEVLHKENVAEQGKEGGDTSCELSTNVVKNTKEIFTDYQTDKSEPEYEKFYQKRRVLEKRISQEKQNQIKWIENEIHHLNILRELLESQNFSHHRSKRQLVEPETQSGVSKTEIENSNSNINENYSGAGIPVYGCTISLAKNSPLAENNVLSERISSEGQQENVADPVLYGMSVSVRNVAMDNLKKLQRIVSLPVGVQISVKNCKTGSNSEENSEKIAKTILKSRPVSSNGNSWLMENIPCEPDKVFQSETYTQFPSSRRNRLNLPSASIQTDFNVRECSRCQRHNCYCLPLSDRSLQSGSPSSKISEKRESSRCSFRNKELGIGYKTSNSTVAELLGGESSSNSKFSKLTKTVTKSNSPSSGSLSKCKCGCKSECKTQLEKEHPRIKPGSQGPVCKNPCQSTSTLNSEKSVDFLSCCCSKVHTQNFFTCGCHIKTRGTECSSKGRSCQCGKRTSKTTENQSCQTEEVTVVSKNLTDNPKLIKASKAQDVGYLYEKKIGTEKKKAILQKLPQDQKVSYEKCPCYNRKLEVEEKVGVLRRSPEVVIPVRSKILQAKHSVRTCEKTTETEDIKIDGKVVEFSEEVRVETKALQTEQTCTCFETFQKKTNKDCDREEALSDKMSAENHSFEASCENSAEKNDNHPRQYFLKIEETEIDDSEESLEMKNSLEVITVKVPIKRAGKGKADKFKCPKSHQISKGKKKMSACQKSCNCCQASSAYPSKSTDCGGTGEFRKLQAEKPQSPVRFRGAHPTPVTSTEETRYRYGYESHKRYENSSSTEVECYCSRSMNSQDSAPRKGIRNENDRHHQCKCNFNYNREFNSYENRKNQERQERVQSEPCRDLHVAEPKDQKRPRKPQTDYYNYDRVEYKTKSELLKEEEEKKMQKSHLPSLQEYLCTNRPDFYKTAERRRKVITEKAKERVTKHDKRMECLMNLMNRCSESDRSGDKRIFTTSEMRGQTMKRYKNLPEVTGKIADRKKKEQYRTNKIVADIYSKKLQIEALKGCGSDF